MTKLFLISNTLLGYKNYIGFNRCLQETEKYFNDELIPFLEKYAKPDDCLIHLGNVFSNKQSLNVNVINIAQNIFEKLSKIIPIYFLVGDHDRYSSNNNINTLSVLKNIKNITIVTNNLLLKNNILLQSYTNNIQKQIKSFENIDYLIMSNNPADIINKELLNSYKKVYTGYNKENYIESNIKCVGSPYQTEPNTKVKGIIILDVDSGADKFFENKLNSKFKTIHINDIKDLEKLNPDDIETNFVDIVVDKSLYDNIEFKIKLTNYNIQNVFCKDETILEEDQIIVNDFFDVDSLLLKKLNDDVELKTEFDTIIKIYNQ